MASIMFLAATAVFVSLAVSIRRAWPAGGFSNSAEANGAAD